MAQTSNDIEINMFATNGDLASAKPIPIPPVSVAPPSNANSVGGQATQQEHNEPIFKIPVKRPLPSATKEIVSGSDAVNKRRRTVSTSALSDAQEAPPGAGRDTFFNPVSAWMKLSLSKQPQTRFRWTEDTLEEQLKLFDNLTSLEYHLFTRPREMSRARFKRLSSATAEAAAVVSFPPLIKRVYADHILDYKAREPLQTLLDTCPLYALSHDDSVQQRYMMQKVNQIRVKHDKLFASKLAMLCPSVAAQSEEQIQSNLEETGREIYRQMKLYMDFLSNSKTPVKSKGALAESFFMQNNTANGDALKTVSSKPTGVKPPESMLFPAAENQMFFSSLSKDESIFTLSKKEEGELTTDGEKDSGASDNDEHQGTYSPSPDEIDEDHLRVDIRPKQEADGAVKKKKKKRKKSKSDSKEKHKKKKKDKKREHSPEELPRAYAHNRNMDGQHQHGRVYRQPGFRPYFRGQNFNPYHNRGFRSFRYNPNFRFQHRGSFRPYSRPYGSRMYSSRPPLPASQRRRDQKFVSESSSDEGRCSRSKTRSRSRSHRSPSRHDGRSPERARREQTPESSAPVQNSEGGAGDTPQLSVAGGTSAAADVAAPVSDSGDAAAKQGTPMSLSPVSTVT